MSVPAAALPPPRDPGAPYTVCLVCLGNICRSPTAEVVLRADVGAGSPFGPSHVLYGPAAVAAQARSFAPLSKYAHPVTVNGGPGVIVAPNGEPVALLAITVSGDRITEIDIIADPERLARLNLTEFLDA